IQGKMLHSVGRIHGLSWDRQTLRRFGASLGTGTAIGLGVSLGLRQLAKLVPIYGQTVGAAAASATSFSVTYALGRSASYYLATTQRKGDADVEQVRRVYRESLKEALDMVRRAGDAAK